MKLVIAIMQDNDAVPLLESLVDQGFRATKLASTGGFLKKGNTTILAGVENEKVSGFIELIKKQCCLTSQIITPPIGPTGPIESYLPPVIDIPGSGANVFVVDVEQFIKV